MDFAFFDPWHQLLPREPGHVVAFLGGRDKADLMAAAAAVLAAEGVPHRILAPGEADPGGGVVALADADGASTAPLGRAPFGTRPLPERTSLAVLVLGANAVGEPAGPAFASAEPPLPELPPWATLEWDHLADLLLGDAGLPADVPVVVALTGLEDQPDSIGLFACVGRLTADPRLPIVVFGTRSAEGLGLRAACREGGGPGT